MILTAGATGRLRPVVDQLLARGHHVRVTARDPDAPHARQLAGHGAEIVRADLDDLTTLRAAARGARRRHRVRRRQSAPSRTAGRGAPGHEHR
jgi:uncharacterized protein YbjT (DUF2867 family)